MCQLKNVPFTRTAAAFDRLSGTLAPNEMFKRLAGRSASVLL
jgi:hypothetical protein